MDVSNLTPDQMEKARNAKTKDEFLALVKEEGVELTDEQLDAVSGGSELDEWRCDSYSN